MNREYGFYFKRKDQTGKRFVDIYGEENSYNPFPLGSVVRGNTVKKKFNVQFEWMISI